MGHLSEFKRAHARGMTSTSMYKNRIQVFTPCAAPTSGQRSVHELVDRPLDGLDETRKLLVLVGCNASSDDGPGDTAGPAKGSLRRHKDVGYVLYVRMSNQTDAALQSTRTFSSHSSGRCRRISNGSVSAVRMMISAIPRLRVFVAVGINDEF